MPASASSARPEIVNRNGAPGWGSGSSGKPFELGLEPFGGPVGLGAVARRLVVELGLQHGEVERGVLGDRVIDDRLDARRQSVLHAVRHVRAQARRRQDGRSEAAPAGGDPPAVGRRLPARQPAQPRIDCLAHLGFERPLHGYTVARCAVFRGFRDRRAPIAASGADQGTITRRTRPPTATADARTVCARGRCRPTPRRPRHRRRRRRTTSSRYVRRPRRPPRTRRSRRGCPARCPPT